MTRVKLNGPCSFTGYRFAVTRGHPFVDVEDAEAAALVGSGLFVYAEDDPEPEPERESRPVSSLDTMTAAELRARAKSLGVRGSSSMKRADLVRAIASRTGGA